MCFLYIKNFTSHFIQKIFRLIDHTLKFLRSWVEVDCVSFSRLCREGNLVVCDSCCLYFCSIRFLYCISCDILIFTCKCVSISWCDLETVCFSFWPVHVDLKVASCNDTFYMTCIPLLRNCRQELYITKLALKKHLIYTCCITEVTINLEDWISFVVCSSTVWWKKICQESWVSTTNCRLYDLKRLIRMSCTCPKVQFVCLWPSCCIQTSFVQGYDCCIHKLRIVFADHITWI